MQPEKRTRASAAGSDGKPDDSERGAEAPVTLNAAEEAQLSATVRKLMLMFVAVLVLGVLSFIGFLSWADSIASASAKRSIPFWKFPDRDGQVEWRDLRMQSLTSLAMPSGQLVHLSTTLHPDHDTEPTGRQFPDLFYEHVVYGISAANPKGEQASPATNDALNEELLQELANMWPRPAHIFRRRSRLPKAIGITGKLVDGGEYEWEEDGFAVAFTDPSMEAERGVLYLARAFGQAAVFKWWGHAWSLHPRDHVEIMQAVVPVASALSYMKYQLPAKLVNKPGTSVWSPAPLDVPPPSFDPEL